MISGIPPVEASVQVSTPATSSVAPVKAAQSPQDTVQLSRSAEQYLQSNQTKSDEARSLVEQLVQAVAAGDSGALSLLTVI